MASAETVRLDVDVDVEIFGEKLFFGAMDRANETIRLLTEYRRSTRWMDIPPARLNEKVAELADVVIAATKVATATILVIQQGPSAKAD